MLKVAYNSLTFLLMTLEFFVPNSLEMDREQLRIEATFLIQYLSIHLYQELVSLEAEAQGFNFLENKICVNTIPRHKINNDSRGIFKVVLNKDNGEILGASLYGKESEELINLIKLAIDQHIPYKVLSENIYTHPTMAESFNDLF